MRERIVEAVERARGLALPTNETETCFRIIDPLLAAMGYDLSDISLQSRDTANQKPDYTILFQHPEHTWFLEAKAWDVSLDDPHAQQAVNYANTQGKRWVVLSNGREWRLYDNHVIGLVRDKLATTVRLDQEPFADFLGALSKSSMLAQSLEPYVRNERLYSTMAAQLSRPDSELVRAMHRALKQLPGLGTIQASEVLGYFHREPTRADHQEPAAVQATLVAPVVQPPGAPESSVSLDEATADRVTFTKPRTLTLPDGTVRSLRGWWQLPVLVADYAIRLRGASEIRAPSGRRYLISHRTNQFREATALPAPHESWFVEGHASAEGHCKSARAMAQACDLEPSGFLIEIVRVR